MLKRLQTAQSIYNRRDWDVQHKKTSYLMSNISQNADRNKQEFSYANYFSEYSQISRPHTSTILKRNQQRIGSDFGNNTYTKSMLNKMQTEQEDAPKSDEDQ